MAPSLGGISSEGAGRSEKENDSDSDNENSEDGEDCEITDGEEQLLTPWSLAARSTVLSTALPLYIGEGHC